VTNHILCILRERSCLVILVQELEGWHYGAGRSGHAISQSQVYLLKCQDFQRYSGRGCVISRRSISVWSPFATSENQVINTELPDYEVECKLNESFPKSMATLHMRMNGGQNLIRHLVVTSGTGSLIVVYRLRLGYSLRMDRRSWVVRHRLEIPRG
jgi:hypothetical protein